MKEPFVLNLPVAGERSWQQQLLDRSPAPMFAKNLGGRYLYVNPEFEKMFGLRGDTILGKTDDEIFPSDQAAAFRENDRRVLESGQPIEFEEEADYVDGKHVSIVYKFPLRDEQDRIYGIGGIATDITDRKLAERILRESEEQLRLLVSNIPGAVYRCGYAPKWTMEFFSDAIEAISGYPPSDFIRDRVRSYISLIHPDDWPRVEQHAIRELGQKKAFEVEYRIRHRDGKIRWVYERGAGVFDEKGNLKYLDGVIFDITDRKQAERALQASEQRFRDAYEKAAVGLAMTDLQGQFLQVNKTYCAITGYFEEELFHSDFATITHPEDRAQNLELVRQLLEGEIPSFVIEKRYVKKDSSVVWVRNSVSLLRDEGGKPANLIALVEDITKRRLSEEKLRESEERLRLMIDTVKDYAIFLLDPEGCIVSWNEGARRIKGYSSSEILGKHFSVFYPEEEQKMGRPMADLLSAKTHGRWEVEGWRVRKDGVRYWADVVMTALRDEKGNLRGFAKITRDRTEQREAELRLEQNRQMLAKAEHMASLGSWEWNIGQNKVIWSEELYRIYGLGRDEFDGSYEGFLKYVHPDDRGLVERTVQQALVDCQPFSYDERIIRPDGEMRTLATQGMVVLDGQGRPERMVGGCLDITRVRLAEQRLRDSHKQLRALAAHLQHVREEERSHISREIHDDLGQALTAVKMDLTIAKETITSKKKVDKRSLRKELRSMLSIVDGAIESVRSIASELRPSVLEHLGLMAAIDWYAEQFEARTGIRCEVQRFVKKIAINKERALSIFRIIQEAMTNVARHAEATKVTVAVKKSGDKIMVRISDNGRGIKPDQLESIRSLGILGMRERATLLEGNLSVEGSRRGTSVFFEVPLNGPEPEQSTEEGSK